MDEAHVITAHNLEAGVRHEVESRVHLAKYVMKVINLIDKKTFKLLMPQHHQRG